MERAKDNLTSTELSLDELVLRAQAEEDNDRLQSLMDEITIRVSRGERIVETD